MLLNKLILASLLIGGFSISAMEKSDRVQSETKLASNAQEWEFLYYVSKKYNNYVESKACNNHVKRLIKAGVNINVKDHEGRKPVNIATRQNSGALIKTLIHNGAIIDKENLRLAIFLGHAAAANALIKLGADINYNNKGQYESILMYTIWQSDHSEQLLSIIPSLIERGADLNATFHEKTAYDYAVEYMDKKNKWDLEMLELLKPKNDNKQECPICYESLKSKIITTKCGHVFHKSCLKRWKAIKNSCPMCVRDL